MNRARLYLAAAAGAFLAPLLSILPAQAITNACASGDGGFCGGQVSSQTVKLELAVPVPAAQAGAGTPIVADTPGLNLREDFDMRAPVSGGSGTGGPDKVIKFAPRGVPSNLCVTQVGGVQSRPVLERCVGANSQVWKPSTGVAGAVVWINKASGLALRVVGDVSGSPVQVRAAGAGTGANEQFTFVGTAP